MKSGRAELKSGLGLNWDVSKSGFPGLKSGREGDDWSSFSKLGLPF